MKYSPKIQSSLFSWKFTRQQYNQNTSGAAAGATRDAEKDRALSECIQKGGDPSGFAWREQLSDGGSTLSPACIYIYIYSSLVLSFNSLLAFLKISKRSMPILVFDSLTAIGLFCWHPSAKPIGQDVCLYVARMHGKYCQNADGCLAETTRYGLFIDGSYWYIVSDF